jgi:hypothetical protein
VKGVAKLETLPNSGKKASFVEDVAELETLLEPKKRNKHSNYGKDEVPLTQINAAYISARANIRVFEGLLNECRKIEDTILKDEALQEETIRELLETIRKKTKKNRHSEN